MVRNYRPRAWWKREAVSGSCGSRILVRMMVCGDVVGRGGGVVPDKTGRLTRR